MSGEHVKEELSAYIDGEAPDPERIARHLQTCEACARHHLQLLRLSSNVRALPRPEVRPEFVTRVMAHIEENQVSARRRRWVFGMPQAALAALVLVVAGAGLYIWSARAPRDSEPRVADNAVWTDEAVIVREIDRLIEEGADLDWLADMDQATVEPDEATSYDDVVGLLADASLESAYDDIAYPDDDLYTMIDALGEEETVILQELLLEYLDAYDDRG